RRDLVDRHAPIDEGEDECVERAQGQGAYVETATLRDALEGDEDGGAGASQRSGGGAGHDSSPAARRSRAPPETRTARMRDEIFRLGRGHVDSDVNTPCRRKMRRTSTSICSADSQRRSASSSVARSINLTSCGEASARSLRNERAGLVAAATS